MDEERLQALADPNSGYFQHVTNMLKEQMVMNQKAEESREVVTLPVPVSAEERAELARRFKWRIKVVDFGIRPRSVPFVAALIFLMSTRNHMLMGNDGEEAIYIDGDLPSLVAKGLSYGHVCRTYATPRLAANYEVEGQQLSRLTRSPKVGVAEAARSVLKSLESNDGSRVCSSAARCSRSADTVFVNHAVTPVSLAQVVATAKAHGASTVRGVCFFQPEMLSETVGDLQAFPGKFFVDRDNDVISFVPSQDESMGFSHPYSSLVSLFANHEYVKGNDRWLIEKHLSGDGVYHYIVKKELCDADFPEVLSANYYVHDFTKWVELEYTSYVDEDTGQLLRTPRRVKTRLLESVYNHVMAAVMYVAEKDLTRDKIFVMLRNHNNQVVCYGDSVRKPKRVWYDMMQRAVVPIFALALARRADVSRTVTRALENVRNRFSVRNLNSAALLWSIMTSGVRSLADKALGVFGERDLVTLQGLINAEGDFSIDVRTVSDFVNVSHVSGLERGFEYGRVESWLPAPVARDMSLLARAAAWVPFGAVSIGSGSTTRSASGSRKKKTYRRPYVEDSVDEEYGGVSPSVAGQGVETFERKNVYNSVDVEISLLDRDGSHGGSLSEALPVEFLDEEDVSKGEEGLEGARRKLFDVLCARQDALSVKAPTRYVERYIGLGRSDVAVTPLVEDDPIAVAQQEYDRLRPGVSLSDEEVKPAIAAVSDLEKTVRFNGRINDAKREMPKPRVIRRSKLRTGGAGRLPGSQSALFSALCKRNTDIPPNRGFVDFEKTADSVLKRMTDVCYVDGWKEKLAVELEHGMWDPVAEDIAEYVPKVPTHQIENMVKQFVSCADEDLTKWLMMIKAGAKPPMDDQADEKVQLPQTILYSEQKVVNAKYSAIQTRVYRVVKSLLRPNISFNSRDSPAEHEVWFNSCQGLRNSARRVYPLEGDITCYDRSQEHMAEVMEFAFYRYHGLNQATLDKWSEAHGVKKATSLMYGIIMFIVMQGLSGDWKTLFRNGLLCWASVVHAYDLQREDIITLDVVGDDFLAEVTRPVDLAVAIDKMTLTFNFTAKLCSPNVIGICSKLWVRVNGWYYYVQDPMRKIESISNGIVVGSGAESLHERWVSLRDDLRHYDNAVVMEALAEAVMERNRLSFAPMGIIRALATFAAKEERFFDAFGVEEKVVV